MIRSGTISFEGGRYRVRVSLPNRGRKTLGYFDTRAEADLQLAAVLDVLPEQELEGVVTFAAFGDRILTEREVTGAVRDATGDWYKWRKHILPDRLAAISLKQLRRAHVLEFVTRMLAKGLAPLTVAKLVTLVRVVLRAAHDRELVEKNVATDIRIPKAAERMKSRKDRILWARPEAQDALVAAVGGPERHIVAFAIGTGLRAGELCALRLADVVDTGDAPHVVVRFGSTPSGPTKTGLIRTVPLFGVGLAAWRAWKSERRGFIKANPHRLAFPRQRGDFRDAGHVLRWDRWKTAVAKAGLPGSFRWHDLRHTCASSLVSGAWGRSWSLEEVQAMLGHQSITTTQIYAHLSETALQRAAKATIGRTLAENPATPRKHSSERGLPKAEVASSTLAGGAQGKTSGSRREGDALIGQCGPMAIGLLAAVSEGRDADAQALAEDLAERVLDASGTQLALTVIGRGPGAMRAAIELAERIGGEFIGATGVSDREVAS